MRIGNRNRHIRIERNTPTRDGLGNDVANWATLCSPWAQVTYGTAGERREAAKDGAFQTATFLVLRDSKTGSVTPADRVVWDGLTWNITSSVHSGLDGMSITGTTAPAAGGI